LELIKLHQAVGGGEIDFSNFEFVRGKPEDDKKALYLLDGRWQPSLSQL